MSDEPYTLEEYQAQVKKYKLDACVRCSELLKDIEKNCNEIQATGCIHCVFYYIRILGDSVDNDNQKEKIKGNGSTN